MADAPRDQTDGKGDKPEDDEFTDKSVSRRGMLAYGGGSALLTWGAAGAGWFTFIYEPAGPEEELVREYVGALDRSNFYTVAGLFHEDAPVSPPTVRDFPDIQEVDMSIDSTEVVERNEDVALETVQEMARQGRDDGRFPNGEYDNHTRICRGTEHRWRLENVA